MLKINTCKRGLHESKTIQRLYQKLVESWGAGQKEYQYKSKSSLCTHWAFEKMFSNVDGFLEEDAEVQVFGDIETEYFEQVCIYSDVQRLKYSKKYADVCFIGFMDRWK